jgi:hypothetical protein
MAATCVLQKETMLMLEDKEKEKIRLEEEYRHEIRSQLSENRTKKPNKLWVFLNSNFALWLLAAIFVTWLGNVYTARQSVRNEELKKLEFARAEQEKKEQTIERLDTEIGYRLSQIQIKLHSLSKIQYEGVSSKNERVKVGRVAAVLESVSQPPGSGYSAAYPEYSNYSLIALVAELRRFTENEERMKVDQVLAHLTGIYLLMDVEGAQLSDATQVATIINRKFISKARWSGSLYYFLDCTESPPFC